MAHAVGIPDPAHVVRLRDVSRTYRRGNVLVPVLRGVTLDVEAFDLSLFLDCKQSGVADGHLPLPPALVDVGVDVDEALSLDVVLGTLRAEMVEGRRLVSYCMRNRDWIGYGFTFLDVLSFGRRVRSAFVCSGLRSSALIRLR